MLNSILLVKSGGSAALDEWQTEFAAVAPALTVRDWYDPSVDPRQVHYALVYQPEPGRLATFPNLRLILSASAGVDHLLVDPDLPSALPIVRMMTDETGQRIADFTAFAALAVIRDLPAIVHAQQQKRWEPKLIGRLASETRVGIMGIGELGRVAALRLTAIGFQVSGWARTPKSIEGVDTYAGPAALRDFLAPLDVLVNLLPQTDDTRAILGRDLLFGLKRGVSLINIGRGSHLDNAALLAALDDGHVRSAVLDVFDVEPIEQDDPLWTHPKVLVTPHIASHVSRRARAVQAARVIDAERNGAPLPFLYDRVRGY